MRRAVLMLTVATMLGAAAGAFGVRALSAEQEAEKRAVLVTTDLADIPGYEVRIWRTDIGRRGQALSSRNRVQLRSGGLADPVVVMISPKGQPLAVPVK